MSVRFEKVRLGGWVARGIASFSLVVGALEPGTFAAFGTKTFLFFDDLFVGGFPVVVREKKVTRVLTW